MQETFNILFVDDEENVLKALKRLFIDEDFEIFTASSGKDGLEILTNNEFAVIVSDQRMPEMTGTDFLLKAKELYPDTIRIILTGYADINAAMNAINEAGAYRYITKPWNDRELLHIIKESVGRYRLVKENKFLLDLTKKQKEELETWSKELEYYVQLHTIDLSKKDKELKILNERLQKNFKELMEGFLILVGLRGKNIRSHSEKVAMISTEMAKKIPLTAIEINIITAAGHLHDIGKIGISDVVLFKEVEELSTDEMSQYTKHPLNGQMAVSITEDLKNAGVLIRHHHENYDGSGFPDKLKGEKIPLGSKLISLADKFERLTRYSDAEDALKIIKSMLGKEFDPDLFNYLETVVYEQKSTLFSSDDIIEAELSFKDLRPSLVISRDVIGGSGLILIKKDTVLTDKNIELLKGGFYMDSSRSGIFVYKKRK